MNARGTVDMVSEKTDKSLLEYLNSSYMRENIKNT